MTIQQGWRRRAGPQGAIAAAALALATTSALGQPIRPADRVATVHELYVGPATAQRTATAAACPTRPVRVVYAGYGEPTTVCPDSYANGNLSQPGPDNR